MSTSKITLYYKAIKGRKYKNSIRYSLQETSTETNLLADKINLQICSGKDKTRPKYTLKQKLFTSWSARGCDLYKSNISKNHFVGDLENRSHFVISEFSEDMDALRIVIYPYYYPYSRNMQRAIVGVRTNEEY